MNVQFLTLRNKAINIKIISQYVKISIIEIYLKISFNIQNLHSCLYNICQGSGADNIIEKIDLGEALEKQC